MAKKKKVEREDALVKRIATLVASGHLERGDASSAADIAAVEAEEGRPLPLVYVKIMERVGGLGRC